MSTRPPDFVRRLLARRAEVALVTALDDLYARREAQFGQSRARRWYTREALKLIVLLFVERLRGPWRLGHGARAAGRRLVRTPRYTLALALTLAIGVAATGTVHALAYWVLLRPVPGVRAPDAVAQLRFEVTMQGNVFSLSLSHPDLLTLRAGLTDSVAGTRSLEVHAAAAGGVERVRGELVTANYFDVLGVRIDGRKFAADEDRTASRSVIVSDAFARRVLRTRTFEPGQTLLVNGRQYDVVGIARAYRGPELPGATALWFPFGSFPEVAPEVHPAAYGDRQQQVWSAAYARAGLVDDVLQERVRSIGERLDADPTDINPLTMTVVYRGLGAPVHLRAEIARMMKLLGAAALLLLTLAVANGMSLTFTRAIRRHRDFAVERALGAGRGDLFREQLIEGGLAGMLAAVLALMLAGGAVALLRIAGLDPFGADLRELRIERSVILWMAVTAFVGGVIVGSAPAWFATRAESASLLRAGFRAAARSRLRPALVVAQFALCVALLIGAALLTRTLVALRNVPLGYDAGTLVAAGIEPGLQAYDRAQRAVLLRNLEDALRSRPELESVGYISGLPLSTTYMAMRVRSEAMDRAGLVRARTYHGSEALTGLLGLSIVAGSDLSREHGNRGVVINESLARTLFPVGDAVGRRIISPNSSEPFTVAGVVRDARLHALTEPPGPVMFVLQSDSFPPSSVFVLARARRSPDDALDAIAATVRSLDPGLPLFQRGTFDSHVAGLLRNQRLAAWLALALTIAGALLSAIGLYATLASLVAERQRELAVRLALGATPTGLLANVVSYGLLLAVVGATLGIAGAFWMGNALRSQLWSVSPFDGASYAGAFLGMIALAALASLHPGWSATRVDPVAGLQAE